MYVSEKLVSRIRFYAPDKVDVSVDYDENYDQDHGYISVECTYNVDCDEEGYIERQLARYKERIKELIDWANHEDESTYYELTGFSYHNEYYDD